MKAVGMMSLAVVSLIMAQPPKSRPDALARQAPQVQIPKPGVPEIMTIEGTWVRAAYNNEGYAIIGYRLANMSIGEEWMLLEFGITLREGVPSHRLTRDALSLETPDGNTVALASVKEYRAANLSALQNRERVVRDSINYFPNSASRGCRLGLFSELHNRTMAWDETELSWQRACVGRLFFQIPGGIAYGQHWLNVKFAKSLVRIPFRILTKDEEELLSDHYGDIRKQVQDAFRKK